MAELFLMKRLFSELNNWYHHRQNDQDYDVRRLDTILTLPIEISWEKGKYLKKNEP